MTETVSSPLSQKTANRVQHARVGFALLLACLLLLPTASWAQTDKVLYSFSGPNQDHPTISILAMDAKGNLYGVASGDDNGVVFELASAKNKWTESVLYTFAGGSDGAFPQGGLVFDQAGNLYGVTQGGGDGCKGGCGTVFELTPGQNGTWTESVLYSFRGETDGSNPEAALVFDAAGNLYGTTLAGGNESCQSGGCGTVFQLAPGAGGTWNETVLHSFAGGKDGYEPVGGVVIDSSGIVYGTASLGGKFGGGIVFKLTPGKKKWKETILHNFAGGSDGYLPLAGLALSEGDLYGTTYAGGNGCTVQPVRSAGTQIGVLQHDGLGNGCGTVFQMTPGAKGQWQETPILKFSGTDGIESEATPVLDKAGNLYVTTFEGGSGACGVCGTALELTPSNGTWTEIILHDFGAESGDAGTPESGFILNKSGNLFGTSSLGGTNNNGTVYEIKPQTRQHAP